MRRNPRKQVEPREIGKVHEDLMHPDLFAGWKDARTGKVSSHGKTPVHVPLEDLTEEQIRELPRAAFNEGEWAQLDDETKTEILDYDPATYLDSSTKTVSDFDEDDWDLLSDENKEIVAKRSPRSEIPDDVWERFDDDDRKIIIEADEGAKARIEGLVKLFVQPYQWAQDPDDDYVRSMVDDGFSSWLRENADHLVEKIGDQRPINDLVEEYEEAGWGREEVERAIDKALQDVSNYDDEVGTQGGFYWDSRHEDQIDINSGELKKALEGMSDDEIKIALEEINVETDGVYYGEYPRGRGERKLTLEQVREGAAKYGISANVEVEYYVSWDPNWDRISNALDAILEDLYPDGPAGEPSPEQQEKALADHDARVVYRWKDGFYVLDLTPTEMKDEGAELGFCIGQRKYGYITGVERGQAKAFSLRTPSGRPKITLYVVFRRDGTVKEIEQAKGKANRLPGWDLGKVGEGKMKQDEVAKIYEFVAGYLKIDPLGVPDIRAAGEEVMYLAYKGDPWAQKLIKSVHELYPPTQTTFTARWPAGWGETAERRRNPANPPPRCPTHGACGGGFCSPWRPSSAPIENPRRYGRKPDARRHSDGSELHAGVGTCDFCRKPRVMLTHVLKADPDQRICETCAARVPSVQINPPVHVRYVGELQVTVWRVGDAFAGQVETLDGTSWSFTRFALPRDLTHLSDEEAADKIAEAAVAAASSPRWNKDGTAGDIAAAAQEGRRRGRASSAPPRPWLELSTEPMRNPRRRR